MALSPARLSPSLSLCAFLLLGVPVFAAAEGPAGEPLVCPIVDHGPGWTGHRILGLFEHGAGTGTRDDDTKRFMNEIDGVRIIREQLAVDGIEIEGRGPEIEDLGVTYEQRRYLDRSQNPDLPLHTTELIYEPLRLDGYDPATGIGFKLVGKDLYWMWCEEAGLICPPHDVYDLPALARWLTEKIRTNPKVPVRHVAFFYDPAIAPQARVRKPGDDRLWIAPNPEAERLLRAQVDHFIACWRTLE